MKTAKLKKNKKETAKPVENEYSIKNMVITVVVISVIFAAFYFLTTLLVKSVEESDDTTTITEIDSTKITLSHLLDRKESEYYVLAIKESLYDNSYSKINYTEIYDGYIEDYSTDETALPFYRVDLDDALNKTYVSEDLNITDDLSNLKLNDEVLFKIKDGRIESYYVGNSDIVEALSNL